MVFPGCKVWRSTYKTTVFIHKWEANANCTDAFQAISRGETWREWIHLCPLRALPAHNGKVAKKNHSQQLQWKASHSKPPTLLRKPLEPFSATRHCHERSEKGRCEVSSASEHVLSRFSFGDNPWQGSCWERGAEAWTGQQHVSLKLPRWVVPTFLQENWKETCFALQSLGNFFLLCCWSVSRVQFWCLSTPAHLRQELSSLHHPLCIQSDAPFLEPFLAKKRCCFFYCAVKWILKGAKFSRQFHLQNSPLREKLILLKASSELIVLQSKFFETFVSCSFTPGSVPSEKFFPVFWHSNALLTVAAISPRWILDKPLFVWNAWPDPHFHPGPFHWK